MRRQSQTRLAHLLCSRRRAALRADALPVQIITSRQNPVVAAFRAAARERRADRRHLLLDGFRLIEAAQSAGVQPESAVFRRAALQRGDGAAAELAGRLAAGGTAIIAASEAVVAGVSPVRTPSGAVALARHRPVDAELALAAGGCVLAAAGVQDPGNLGAVIRAADAAGCGGVLVTEGSADPFGWKALRGAMGSTFRVPVVDAGPVTAAVAAARAHGARVLAAVPRGGVPLHECDLSGARLVLIGGEGGGLSGETAGLAEERVSVPMRAGVESLNAAVAAALVAYEARRQRVNAVAADSSL